LGSDTLTGIEGLIGSGYNDVLLGNSVANMLNGGLGDDSLEGQVGDDTMLGGGGDDTLLGGAGDDQLSGQAGLDWASYANSASAVTVLLSITAAQNTGGAGTDTLGGIENVIGSDHDDTLVGNNSDNVLNGLAGNDTLNGGGGSDYATYATVGAGVVVDLDAGSATGGSGSDSLSLIENVIGSSFDDTLTGDANANILQAGVGNDTIDGGASADTMVGGLGDDTYVVDNGDIVTEDAASGIDAVQSSGDYTLLANVENLTLAGSAIAGAGNTMANVITGNANANSLAGFEGNDTIVGMAGDDRIYGMLDGEQLFSGEDSLAGGEGNDSIYGGDGNDILNGDSGQDELVGEFGDDRLNGGADGDYISGGDGADTLMGGSGDDLLFGSAGVDRLSGGAGMDVLSGAENADKFDFDAALDAATNVDTISDFAPGEDMIRLDQSVFTAFPTTNIVLTAANFYSGPGVTAAHDLSDRIIYDSTSGDLYYDPDGTGAGGAMLFATLTTHPDTLSAADFLIIA
jgi:Ca2+-binding RTX toxin-like protein